MTLGPDYLITAIAHRINMFLPKDMPETEAAEAIIKAAVRAGIPADELEAALKRLYGEQL